ncbi:serine hydrolase domain-containing protein [Xylanimonas protaetiae]|uniref:serine hydrolase domain-containing protein n=1 Tax=Xylanimonas protaetiae TaxID=2509457 RepID=UPI0013EB97DF|nr:serine hydrolase domain-containing protein [Xylanimonas protaetiae]
MTTETADAVQGTVHSGFEPLRAEFVRNFTHRDELGAALAVAVDGDLVADLWGGVADAYDERPWERNTLQLIFSGSKGLVATALLVLVERAGLDLDRPVSVWWPEFGAAGKDRITLRQVVTFTAGLPALHEAVSQADVEDPEAMAAVLAAQPPEDDPRAYPLMYGPFTPGWIVAEIIRRVDGRDLARFFHDEVAAPHGLDVHFGVRPGDLGRVARTEYGAGFLDQFTGYFTSSDPLTQRVWQNPMPFPPDAAIWSDPRRLTALVPAVNAVGTARDLARLYSLLAADATRDEGEPAAILGRELLRDATREHARHTDAIIGVPMVYGGGGYRLRTRARPGADGASFGHDGGGGSANQAWPRVRAGVSYVPNRLIALGPDDRRAGSVVTAAAACFGGGSATPGIEFRRA